MKTNRIRMVLLGAALLLDARVSGAEIGEAVDPGVIVYVNKDNLLIPELGLAQQAAARIFASIGVAVEFRAGEERKSIGEGAVSIGMRLEAAAPAGLRAGTLAHAMPFGASGTRIHIFCDRVRKAWPDGGTGAVLGHVMAHEIGHVLQGVSRHSAEGVMKASWEATDYRRMKSGTLSFDPADSELIHAALMAAPFSIGVTQETEITAAELFQRAEQLHAKGRYAEAEPLYKEALAIEERVPVLNALADLYHVQGRDREAEPVIRRALELGERRLHPQDLAIAASLNTLADIYRSTHRYVSAEPLYRRALAILEAALGPTHPSVGVVSNLASLRVNTGRYDEAGELFRRALAISEGASPANSIQIAGILNNIAVCAIERGRFGAAEPYLLRSMRLRESAFASDDPAMISLLETYALVLRKTRRASQAKQVDARIAFLRQGRSPK